MADPHFTIIEAPSALGLAQRGVELLPGALLAAGLAERLGAHRGGRVAPPPHDSRPDDETGMLNPRGIAAYAAALADAVGPMLDRGEFPVVLGGDCTIMLGPLLALRRRGRYGLLFMDGHADFYQPEAEPNGEGASMELAFATGRGPSVVTDLDGLRPLAREEDIVAFGCRDAEEAAEYGSQRVEETAITVVDLAGVRTQGAAAAAASAVASLARPERAGFWIHLDADVLDDAIMPAVDARLPGGLAWAEVVAALRAAIGSGAAVGIDVTIFNPTLDEDGSLAAALVDTLAAGLRP